MIFDRIGEDEFLHLSKSINFKSDYRKYFSKVIESPKTFGEEDCPTLFSPILFSNEGFDYIQKVSSSIFSIFQKSSALYYSVDELNKFLDFPEEIHNWLNMDCSYENIIPFSRYDSFWDGKNLKIFEFNTDGSSGMLGADLLADYFKETKTGGKLLNKNKLQAVSLVKKVVDTLLVTYSSFSNKKKPNIAIVDFLESGTLDEFKAIANECKLRGLDAKICDIRKLKYTPKGLYDDSFKIDLIYRRAVTDEMFLHKSEINDFIKAYQDRAVCVAGPIKSHIAHSKLLFCFLTSKLSEKYFTEDEVRTIRTHFPKTFRLIDGAFPLNNVLNEKDKFFIKPHNSYGTKGMYVDGAATEQEVWKEIIENLLIKEIKDYIVQEKVIGLKKNLLIGEESHIEKFNINIGPFILDGELSGFLNRISSNKLITTSSGFLPTFWKYN